MQFADIIGQKEVKQQLVELLQHNRLSHALLFVGKEGNGLLSLALAFAQYVVCEKVNGKNTAIQSEPSLFGEEPPTSKIQRPTFSDSCGICSACIKAQQLVHPDIHFSYPTVTKKPGQKPIATDFITEWREFIQLRPYGNSFDWFEQITETANSQGQITAKAS